MRQFVPLTDELLYERPEAVTGPLLPYQVDRPCHRWLAMDEGPDRKDRDSAEGNAACPGSRPRPGKPTVDHRTQSTSLEGSEP